jgi:CubicO group peptidase (beta-lactamase class C family)
VVGVYVRAVLGFCVRVRGAMAWCSCTMPNIAGFDDPKDLPRLYSPSTRTTGATSISWKPSPRLRSQKFTEWRGNMLRPCLPCCAAFCLLIGCVDVSSQAGLATRIDAIVEAPIKAGKVAGASVAVVKGSDTVVMKGYGFADLELGVPTPPRATYEIGSVTKQFTAASILLLAEQGKLSLDDDVTKFLPDYPTQGNRVPLRRLLNHTSGIKGYTELPEFREFALLKKPRQELVKLFGEKPFDFKPGEEQIYNNSAFFLLGLIIEKASGQTYAEFVQEHLFDRVGMKDSYYCSERTIRKNHAHGYDTDRNALVLKAYLDHTWPYAAGSLCSNTIDLVGWNKALHGGKVLKAESYREMTSPGTLNDGTRIRYGMGISLSDTDGRRTLFHGGGINGFLSESEYYPNDDLVIVVLLNTAGPVGPRELARQIAETVLGKAPDRTRPFQGDLTQFTGLFTGRGRGRPATVRIEANGHDLTFTNTAGSGTPAEILKYYGNDTFGFKETLVTFEKENEKVSRLRLDTGGGYNILSRQAESQK